MDFSNEKIDKLIQEYGIFVTMEFDPPENMPTPPVLRYRVKVRARGVLLYKGRYTMGCAHCPAYKQSAQRVTVDVLRECKSGRTIVGRRLWPSARDVVSSVFRDAYCGDYGFKEFCGELDYDSDSRKARKIWKTCSKISNAIQKAFSPSELGLINEAIEEAGL